MLALLAALLGVALLVRVGAGLAAPRVPALRPWANLPAATGCGLAMSYLLASTAHFLEPQRSGLVAIVPGWLPWPEAIVTLTGALELLIAACLCVPAVRRIASIASAIFLVAVFPANVIAAGGVDHPAAPDTPLVPRLLAQLALIACSLIAARATRNRAEATRSGREPWLSPRERGGAGRR